ncbi:MAG: outer membrane protein assembly factor BamD [Bacteroidota bacterium]
MFRKSFYIILAAGLLFMLSSCKSEFERIRTGNDIELKYQKALEYFDNEEWYRSQVLLEQITGILRGDPRIERVYFSYAYTHFHLKKYVLATYYFKNFTTTFPNSEYTEEAMFMSAFSNYKLSPTYRLDQTYTEKAIDEFQLFVNSKPTSDRVERANALIDEMRAKLEVKAFEDAQLYFKLQDFLAANHSFQNFVKDFPDAQKIEEARFMVLKSYYRQAQNTIEIAQLERFEDTVDAYFEFVDRHPNSRYQKEAEGIFQASNERIERLKTDSK